MYTCDACGEEFGTLTELRVRHDCPVEAERRRREAAHEYLRAERGLEIGDRCRVIGTGEEVEIVDVEPSEDDDVPTVIWVPAGAADTPERRRSSPPNDLV